MSAIRESSMVKTELSEFSSGPTMGTDVYSVKSSRGLLLLLALLAGMAFSAASWGQAAADPNQPSTADPQGTTTTQPARPRPNDSYVIGDDDVLAISVWKDTELTREVTVRSDGRISLPLVGEIQAEGRTP